MISRVKLKNWKSHLDSEFKFSPGINALLGINGAGKSSVMDAISFALFGTFPSHSSRKIGLDSLIMQRPQKKSESHVEIDINMNGKTYSIKRAIKSGKGTSHAEIRENGRLLDVNPSSVTSYVESLLNIDYSLFSRAVYSEQNNIDYFLTIPKGKRMQHIDGMLRLDKFDKVREISVSMRNSMENRRQDTMKILEKMGSDESEAKVQELSGEIGELILEEGRLQINIDNTWSELSSIRNKVKSAETIKDSLSRLKTDLEVVKSGIRGTEENLRKKPDINLDETKAELENLGSKIDGLKNKLSVLEEEISRHRDSIASKNTEIRLISRETNDLSRLESECPVCKNKVTDEHKREIISKNQEREKLLREEVGTAISKIEEIKQALFVEKESLEILSEEKRSLRSKLDEFERYNGLETKLSDYNQKKTDLEFEMAGIEKEFSQEDFVTLWKELERLVAEEREFRTKLQGLKEIKQSKELLLEEYTRSANIVKGYRKSIEKYTKGIFLMDEFVKVLKLTQDQLREEFLANVNQIMRELWKALYPYRDFTEIRLGIDGDYTLQLRSMDDWIPVDGVASGGERSLACLVLRIAFSFAFIPNLKWLILDEPTHNLDSSSIESFSKLLKNGLEDLVKQIFLITHEDRIIENIDGCLYKLERDKRNNGATTISAF